MWSSSPAMTLDTTSSINEAAFDMSDFLTNTTTPDSTDYVPHSAVADDMHFAIPDWSAYRQTRASVKHHGQLRILSDENLAYYDDAGSRMKLNDDEPLPTGPKKARRQAQNRAAQRAFRERKEKYIQELEEKVVGMTKEISTLRKDRSRLQGLLNVAQAEVQTLKTMPQPVARHSTASSEISCNITGNGKQSILLAIDINVRGSSASNQSNTLETSLVQGSSDAG